MNIGEPFAAGFFEDRNRNNFYRIAKATLRYREHCALPEYKGEPVYPNGPRSIDNYCVLPHFSYTFVIDEERFEEKDPSLAEICLYGMPRRPVVNMDDKKQAAGELYVHTNPNFERILKEGLDSYKERILKAEDDDFREGCMLVIESIEVYRRRCLEHLESVGAESRLIQALKKVPMQPAETLYEALVAWNFIYYIDFCDNIGEMDRILHPYHNGENAEDIIAAFFRNVDANDGWSLRIGPDFYPISAQILRASRGIRRPSIELCIDENLPDEIWEIAAELIRTGNCNPALYNYPLYQKALRERFPHIPQSDLEKFCGCGCTETMLSGISRVGSVDGAYHLLYAFSNYMREHLCEAKSFEEFYDGCMQYILKGIHRMYDIINAGYRERAVTRPHPVRTVLVDDCIDNETDFNAGGARWNWAMVNFPGSINVIESMLAVKDLIFDKCEYSPQEFLTLLEKEDPMFYRRLRKCPHYGVNDKKADSLAADFFHTVFTSADGYKMCFGEGILTSSVQFITYVHKGEFVPATPDGRKNGEPLCDSLAPIMGNDTKSITQTLNSISSLPLAGALGTPVVNIRLHKDYSGELMKPLVLGFFEKGGMMLQISCLSTEDMLDAMEHPDRHRDLMIRVGGYTEYFVNLRCEQQLSMIHRTEFTEL